MKISICIFCFVLLIVTVNSYPTINLETRGFKNEERFGHGFGKRTSSQDVDIDSLLEKEDMLRPLMTSSRLAAEIKTRPNLAEVIVGKFVDRNHDGYITENELFPERFEDSDI
ncbi:sensorin-A-like [Tubulanus polymorphus]|uniref:sensorin-A-like n=1 Tax=Tubulanus polymorphus TaxID=672921 RepID=UPI003DA6485D